MKKLLFKILLFLLPIIMIWIATEVFYRTVPNHYTFKHKQLVEQKRTIETLVFGDSHAFFGINPEFISSNTFNASNISQTLYFDELLFNKHVANLQHLKHVVITIGYASLSQVDNTSEDVWRKYFYANQMDLDVPLVSSWDIKKYSLALTQRFNKSLALASKYHTEGSIIECDTNGWGNYYVTENSLDLDETAKSTAKKHEDGLMDFNLNLSRIRNIIHQCAERNIKVQLVFMPVSKAYSKHVNLDKVEGINTSLQDISKFYRNTNYLNLFQDHRFHNNDFYDANHLNTDGAKKCSLIIEKVLD